MLYKFIPITMDHVTIIEKWRYNGFEKQLYMDCYHESSNRGESPLKGPRGSKGFAVYKDNRIAGLFEFYFEEKGVYLGLALAPDLVGRRLSKDFILSGIEFGKDHLGLKGRVYLEVDRRNIQGIRAYEKTGFKVTGRVGDEIEYSLTI